MCNQKMKLVIFSINFLILFFALIHAQASAQGVFPEVNMEVENMVPFDQVMRTAQHKAKALWGDVCAGEPVPCCDDDGDLVAYMIPFAIGASEFPNHQRMYDRILKGRAAYEALTKQLQDMVTKEQDEAAYSVSIQREDAGFSAPPDSEDVQAFAHLDEENARKISDCMAARTLAKQIKYGINEYGTIFVSARYDRFPVPLSCHYLSPFFSVWDLAAEKARQALGVRDIVLSRYYFLGRDRGQFFEFSVDSRRVLIEAYQLAPKQTEQVLVLRGKKRTPNQQMRIDMDASWKQATMIQLITNTTGGADGEVTVTNPHLVPDVDWCRGCTPTSASMVIGYWDNFVNNETYAGYGRLIDFWCDLSTYSDGSGSMKNVPNLLDELRIAFNTSVNGTTSTGVISSGIETVCNNQNGYGFESNQHYKNGGDWNWSVIKNQIDNNRPFVWSVGISGQVGHSLCAWGYTDSKYVITYSTWGRGRDDWYYKKYDNGSYLDWSYVHTVDPGGSMGSQCVVIDAPDGGETLYAGETYNIWWYQFGTLVSDVDLYYSTDGGATWKGIAGYVLSKPNSWNKYVWNVPNIKDSNVRVKVKAYDIGSYYVAGDGSFDNFTIIDRCDLYDDGESYRSFSPKTVVYGQGASFTAKCDVRNGGGESSGSFEVKCYASTNTIISASDHYLGKITMSSISAGSYKNCDLTCNLPSGLPQGSYYIGWIIDPDNDVNESNETNNKAYKQGYKLTVEAAKANLYDDGETYRSFTPQKIVKGMNETFKVYCDVRNGGVADSGTFKVKFYASLNQTISSSDYLLGVVSMPNIEAGKWKNCDLSCAFPAHIPIGSYWVGWIIDADNDVTESNENDNIAYKQGYQLSVGPGASPDIKVNGQDNPLNISPGTPVNLTVSLNPGGMEGVLGDLFIFAQYNGGAIYSWIYPGSWIYANPPKLTAKFHLAPFNGYSIFKGALPKGNWKFYFVVDKGDGAYQGTFKDSVTINVN